MAPSGLAIILGAGPAAGAGIARVLASPAEGNLAVALLSRTGDAQLATEISKLSGGGVLKAFQTDTSEDRLRSTFEDIKTWTRSLPKSDDGQSLRLKLSVFNIKHSHKVPFAEETPTRFTESLTVYTTGAMIFSQLSINWMLSQSSQSSDDKPEAFIPLHKAGTVIFTSSLGSMRSNAGFAAYGATRAGVRMLAQSLAREYSSKGIHVVHAIGNGWITNNYDESYLDSDLNDGAKENTDDTKAVLEGKKIKGASVGKLYLGLMQQACDLWVHELDMRPAGEPF
ncbi:hypothetical protein N7520_005508 [Penicillium odoratum]|uniref:uncharacterized protein n=1 Tax=Penicillium odoratum TaxID=1167516 RepID=UPI002548211A|nr:uncharacterized protein N7520_005508 [Penicillium odoratum]KAJ5765949.1 hypothetical protein N7520_005508 [Penicillium odoratum]